MKLRLFCLVEALCAFVFEGWNLGRKKQSAEIKFERVTRLGHWANFDWNNDSISEAHIIRTHSLLFLNSFTRLIVGKFAQGVESFNNDMTCRRR